MVFSTLAGRSGTAGPRSGAVLVAFPLLKLALHLAVGAGYGYHRDELYYLACADHLDWGYVDHPPLSIAVLVAARALLGDSVRALRVVPAVAGALTILLVGLIARRLGGGPFALALGMSAAFAAPIYLALDQYFSMNALDLLVWATAAWLLVLLLTGATRRLWLALGLLLGFGLLNKISVLWLGFGLAVGLLATPQRAWLRTPWPWIAAAITFAMFLPHILWQVGHGWPTLVFIHNATTQKMVRVTIRVFLRGQWEGMLLVSAPVWIAGLVFCLWLPGGKPVRPLGWAYLAILALLAVSRTSRVSYIAPVYTWLFAAGGVTLERALRALGDWSRTAALTAILAMGASIAPVVLPILPPPAAASYSQALGAGRTREEKTGIGALPEFLAQMCGWEEIVATVARVHAQIPKEERGRATILAPNYGVAGAIDFLGRRYGLPRAVSGHNNYWLWGPRGLSGDPTIVIGRSEAELGEWFEDVRRVAETDCDYCMPYENRQPIWIARQPRLPLPSLWPRLRYFQ